MLDFAKFSNMPDEDFDSSAASSYREWREGGSLYRTLRLAFIAGSVSTEKCAPMSRILNGKYKMATIEEREDFEFLEKIFNKVKSNPESCVECAAKEISARFPQITDIEYITNAFIKSKTLEAFHHRILVPRECATLDNQVGFYGKVASFPPKQEDSDERIPLSEFEKKIDEIIHSGRPIGLGNICMAEIETSKMTLGVCKDDKLRDQKEPPTHAVVISGVGTVCYQKDNCLKAYKVQNSWGQAWQDQYNDGWVVARELLNRINNSKKNISLVWIADRESDN